MLVELGIFVGLPLAAASAFLVIHRAKKNTKRMDDSGYAAIISESDPDKFDSAVAQGWNVLKQTPKGEYAEVLVKTGEERHTLKVWKAKSSQDPELS